MFLFGTQERRPHSLGEQSALKVTLHDVTWIWFGITEEQFFISWEEFLKRHDLGVRKKIICTPAHGIFSLLLLQHRYSFCMLLPYTVRTSSAA